jgi:nicotinate-nucleotide adenylyltransferase
MKVGLYFGSFNPIHIGHCIIASHLVQHTELDQVWLVVSPQNPFKPSSSLLNEYHRLALVKLALEGETKLKASDIEFHLPRPSYTIDTMTYLKEKHPGYEFSIIMGSDGVQNLHNWKNAAVLVKNHPIYVYKRSGYEVISPLDIQPIVLDAPLLEISSTRIRKLLKEGKSARYLLPDNVLEEIKKGGYYK